ncbi:MAG: hypothetical protein J6U10_00630, partial [Lachnospiraceae bacterium]|nr:hypothetical protein [Lachnospiraceae bacterium]
ILIAGIVFLSPAVRRQVWIRRLYGVCGPCFEGTKRAKAGSFGVLLYRILYGHAETGDKIYDMHDETHSFSVHI